jgi:hypothetical protein
MSERQLFKPLVHHVSAPWPRSLPLLSITISIVVIIASQHVVPSRERTAFSYLSFSAGIPTRVCLLLKTLHGANYALKLRVLMLLCLTSFCISISKAARVLQEGDPT